jgi:hypothetical protein
MDIGARHSPRAWLAFAATVLSKEYEIPLVSGLQTPFTSLLVGRLRVICVDFAIYGPSLVMGQYRKSAATLRVLA